MTPEDFDSFPPPEAAALEVVHVRHSPESPAKSRATNAECRIC